jgi:succinate dehydrogenase/fumarate reductase cytochrome b subunit
MKQIKHWQDAVNAVLGVWLVLSPWAVGYSGDTMATANAVVVGVALIAVALGAMLVPHAWEEWSEAVLGLWLIASPWVLGFSGAINTMRVAVATGVVIALLALWTLATDKDYSAWLRERTSQ